MSEKYNKKLSFVIPCYNSENTIEGVVIDICREFPTDKHEREIILVSDGSKDSTFKVIREITSKYTNITAINLSKNFGQDAATLAGYSVSTGDYIITLDDDGQNPPSEAHKLIKAMDEYGYDVVFGKYDIKKQSAFKNFGSRINDMMADILINKPRDLELNSYFIINRFVCNEILGYKGAFPYIWGLILRTTDNIGNANIEHKARENGKSNYTFSKMVGLWLNGFTSFSIRPIRIASLLGTLIAIVGFIYCIYIVVKKLTVGEIEGWTSMMAIVLLISGLQLLMIGLLGEYIGRNYLNSSKAPQYVIREKIESDTDDFGINDEK